MSRYRLPFQTFNLVILNDENGVKLKKPKLIEGVYIKSESNGEGMNAHNVERYKRLHKSDFTESIDTIVAQIRHVDNIWFGESVIKVTGWNYAKKTGNWPLKVPQEWMITTLTKEELEDEDYFQ